MCVPVLCFFHLFLLYTFFTSCNCTQTVLKVNLNLEATFSINVSTSLEINPKWKNEREQQTLTFCFCLFFSYTACLTLSISFYFCPFFLFFLVQIQDFSSGFWDGTKLACWMKGETPWRFFPKLSIYLRATNSSQSFRITILPQVPG